MKKSRFIKTCYTDNNELLVLNTFTGGLYKADSNTVNELEEALISPNSINNENLKQYLISKKIIVEDDLDENARAEMQYIDIAHSYKKLLLTILPTEDCNFRCPYCYEEHNIGHMTSDVIDGIKNFINKNLHKYDMLQVNWFGGEPLEAFDIVEDLSQFFLEKCAENRIIYRAGMTTNGYLLTPEMFKRLYKLHVVDYQITLDGLKETHNLSRPHRDGSGTYDVILNNLVNIKNNIDTRNFIITIRTNIIKSVMDNIDEYIEFLSNEFGNDNRFGVLFKITWSNDKETEFNAEQLLPTGDLMNVLKKCYDKKLRFAINRNQICSINGICYAAHSNAFVIGSNGKIYKCTVEFKKDINNIGYLNKAGKMIINNDKLAFWVAKAPFKGGFEKCSKCFFQPACMGVYCPINRFDENGNHICVGMKEYVDIYMKLCAQNDNMTEVVNYG